MTHTKPTSVIGFTIGEHNFIIAWTAETSFQAGFGNGPHRQRAQRGAGGTDTDWSGNGSHTKGG